MKINDTNNFMRYVIWTFLKGYRWTPIKKKGWHIEREKKEKKKVVDLISFYL